MESIIYIKENALPCYCVELFNHDEHESRKKLQLIIDSVKYNHIWKKPRSNI